MKTLLLILIFYSAGMAQEPEWKLIKEMSGEIPDHPGLTIEFYAAEVSRGDDLVKLLLRMNMPWGAPRDIFKPAFPPGFDISSVTRIEAKAEFNCDTLVMKVKKNSSEVYQFNGRRLKSKEPPFTVEQSNVFVRYFCERGPAPTTKPRLVAKPDKSGKPSP